MRIFLLIVLYAGFMVALVRPLLADEPGGVHCWRIDGEHSRLEWTANWAGNAVHGGFSHFSAGIRFSPEDPEDARIEVHVPLSALHTEDPNVRDLLIGDAWFAPDRFPEAVYRSTRIVARKDGGWRSQGTLSLKGVGHPLALDFSLAISGERARAQGRTVIDRTWFGIGDGPLAKATAPEVEVRFEVEAQAIACR